MSRFNLYADEIQQSSVWKEGASEYGSMESIFPPLDMQRRKIRASCIPYRCPFLEKLSVSKGF